MADQNLIAHGGPTPQRDDRSIGAILIEAGRLTSEEAERIGQLQRNQALSFGEAGMSVGLLAQADVDFALALQFNYPYLLRGKSAVSEEVVAAYSLFTPEVEALRALRGQLMQRWFDPDASHKTLAIVSADRKEGRSYIAANLAVLFSQLGKRTLLIDADMRNSSLHRLFGLDNSNGLSAVLSGRGGPHSIQRIPELGEFSVLTAGSHPPNPSDLLARPLFSHLLQESAKGFDIVLVDSPATAHNADAQSITLSAGGALIVVRKDISRFSRVQGIADHGVHLSATIVGTVLNDY